MLESSSFKLNWTKSSDIGELLRALTISKPFKRKMIALEVKRS